MALWSTSCQGKWHGVGTGGEQGMERRGGPKGTADGNVNGQGTAKGEAYESEEDNGNWKRKRNRWWGKWRSTGSSTGEGVPIRFGTYNIRNGRNGGLELALRVIAQANMDLGIFQGESARTEYTPTIRLGTASSLWTRQAYTAAEWPYSTGRHHFFAV